MLLKFDVPKREGVNKSTVTRSVSVVSHKAELIQDDFDVVLPKMRELFSKYNWKVITTEKDLVDYIGTRKQLGIDCETTGLNPYRSRLVGFSLATENDCVYIPLLHKRGVNYQDDTSRLTEIFRGIEFYGFNAKFDLKFLHIHAKFTYDVKWCGYLAARLMNSAESINGLKDLYSKYVDPSEPIYHFKDLFKNSFDCYDPAIVGAYAAVDALKHIRLGKWQESKMQGKSEMTIMKKVEIPLIKCLQDMEETGVMLDVNWCNELTSQLQKDLDAVQEKLQSKYPGFNPGSPKQVAELLYDKLGLPQINGRGTGSSTIMRLSHPIVNDILEYRKAQKLISTYSAKMPQIATKNIVHCTYNQYGADTGRFSSEDPNLQNIPRDNRFRRMFIARPGKMLVSCDYSQQEVYTLASMANDEEMKRAYELDMDFYAYMASIVFEVPYETCQKHHENETLRNQMKSIVLGINYDMGIYSLSKDIGKSVEETKEIYAKFFRKCPRIKEFRQKNLEFAIENGYVQTILGRKRWLPALSKPDFECSDKEVQNVLLKLKSQNAISQLILDAKKEGIEIVDNRYLKAYETRQVVNSIIQGSASDMMKLAMIEAYNDPELKRLGCKLLLQIHDELIAEFPEETAREGGDLLAKLMVRVGSDLIGIRMKCEPTVMKYWQKD